MWMRSSILLALSIGVEEAIASPQSEQVAIRYAAQPLFKVQIGPKPPFRPMPASTPRTKDCTVKTGNSGDDSTAVLEAIKECNDGGRVVFAKGTTYTIAKALDLSKLSHIDLDIQGTIKFAPNVAYWTANSFKYGFQDAMSFFQLGGEDVNVYGGGTIDGSGGSFSGQGKRPLLFAIAGLKGGVVADLTLKDSPQWFNLIKDSQDVVYSNLHIRGKNHNTDGWDTLKSSNIVIQNSVIDNGDDCVSFKPGSVDIVVQGLSCSGSHGISVGSLGQYKGQNDIVENIYVYNISMNNASNGARIKTWPGHGTMSGVGSGGGGTGRVRNVTFDGFRVRGVDSAIEITQCYGEKDAAKCKADPSKVIISNVLMKDFSGTTSGKRNVVGSLACSSTTSCQDIQLKDIKVKSPSGSGGFACSNVHPSGISC